MRRVRCPGIGVTSAWAAAIALSGCGGAEPPPPKTAPSPEVAAAPAASTPAEVAHLSAGPPAGADLSGDAKAAYDRGFQAWTSGDLKSAKAAFGDAVSRAPNSGAARYSLGCVLERLGDTSGALDAFRAGSLAKPRSEPAVGGYAVLLARSGRGPEAEQFLVGERAKDPQSVALIVDLAEVKSLEGDSAGCQQLAQQALAKQPDFKDAMVVIARDYYRSHRWDLARYALGAILDGAGDGSIPPRDAGNPQALLLRALIERESGQRKQAIADFERAIAQRSDLFEAYANLGEMKLEAGNATEAESPLEKAVRYSPNMAVAHLDLGDCYRLLGQSAEAKREFDTALGMDSTLAGAHYDLGLLYLFSPSVPGVGGPEDQITRAIAELQNYKSMRGAKALKGQGDDVDELLSTAKRKQSELQLKKQAASAASTPPSPSATGGAPSASAPHPVAPAPAPSVPSGKH